MKKIVLFFVLAAFVSSLVLAQTFHAAVTAEPTSNGKPLGFWLNQYTNSPESGRQEADKAIILCGTNALTWLLSELHATNSPLDLEGIPSGSNSGDSPADRRHWRAITGFWILGSIGKPAIGALTNMIISDENPLLSAYALAAIGTNSYSTLTNLMTHSDEKVRREAIDAIDYYGYQSKKGGFAVPALVQALTDDSSMVRFNAAMALCVICERPELAVPELKKTLKDQDKGVRLYAVRALGRYEQKSPIPDFVSEIIPMLDDRESDVRAAAAYDLGNVGSAAKSALPALKRALNDEAKYSGVREAAANAIKKIDPELAKELGIQ